MTYNSKTDEIIIACCENKYHNRVYSISADDFNANTDADDFDCYFISCMVTSIDYNEVRNQYIVGVTSRLNYYVILDYDFNLITTIGKYNNHSVSDKDWARQAICSDENYIYALNWFKDSNGSYANDIESRIVVFDWNGNYIKTIYLSTYKNPFYIRLYEIESMTVAGDRIFLLFNCIKNGKDRQFCYYDLMNNAFKVEYYIDESVTEENSAITSDKTSFVIKGVPTKLHKNRITNEGKKFVGWYAYRKEVDKWYYESADKSIKAWYKENQQPDGYTKFVYNNEHTVSQTGANGEHVYMCAKWESINKFFVEFLPNGGSGTMADMEITHGTSTQLLANQFAKTDRTFIGWNAYWVEKNKWYYQSPDGQTQAWYQEGCQPEGYVKYTYANRQNVARTANKGGHIQMYAKWDEFYIYYDADTAVIKQSKIKNMTTGKYPSNNMNQIIQYDLEDIQDSFRDFWVDDITFFGYYLYRQEVNKWYYESADGSTRGWYKKGLQPEGYNLYLKKFSAQSNGIAYLGGTAPAGEHLVLRAAWGYPGDIARGV